ncbi:MBL fold metallo-hydrolase [Blastococcus sp. MG754426]|uniref:Glyoxylase, beta-lactamase superfamily II n=3 Tax=Geodermatophilaceae TaxID=85030 RepID=A0A285VKC3_9ACTN|nr:MULTISPECIES: MBL fold metallo-hydrolase [Geodermatophilaceae]MCF6510051.1 MBL fold metallo-hydrolase [Blastococcus sp. MG754426]MCF6514428.1 MBL fold metallo-hydrolase [Blastococcus sp. MG754427]SOC53011.1 Glyoxylase, beta-lactamase superfamily II [Blastococcus aggregatus]SSC22154.1 Glyoxylase, beta-lactamase superfamily II [Klenkia terrae]
MFDVQTIETSSLGDRSYLIDDGEVAVVIDPQRDIDRVLDLVARRGVRVTHVLETHVHNDYVTGGPELARETGAAYVLPSGSDAELDHVAVSDGEVIAAGRLRLTALHTPGHTHHHVSYALADGDGDGDVQAVFTGGSMLYGATGRTDLVSPEVTDELTHAQYHSVRRLARELPAEAQVFPTHGFGSFCSATPTSGTSSTIGEQAKVNPALTQAEQEYVDTLLAGLDAFPAYYARMAPINRRGPAPVDLSMPEKVDPAGLRRRIEAGEWVVDLRERTAFAAGHLTDAMNVELGTNFVTYLGWLYRYGEPLTLIGESEEQVAEARRELVRIGVDELAGAAIGDVESLADGQPLRSYPVSDFAGLAEAMERGPVQVLDARRNDERADGFVRGSQHIPLHELADRLDEVPQGEVWVYCGSGYRASIAASVLDRPGRSVVLVNDSYESAGKAGLEDA